MRQEYLRAAAEAYANITGMQSDCYHYLHDGFNTTIQARLADRYTDILSERFGFNKYQSKIITTALSECQYPINTSTGFAWSGNQRAAFTSIPKATWSRNELCKQVNFMIDNMRCNASIARLAIAAQLLSA